MAHIVLKKGKEQKILSGHPWIYNGEVSEMVGSFADGDIIRVKDYAGKFLGVGFINRASKILVRLISENKEIVDKPFFKSKIDTAFQYRNQFIHNTNAKRIVFSEGDLLPGLIADYYDGVIVLQTLTLGMDRRKNDIVETLKELLNPQAIYERNDVPVRKFEGLQEQKGLLYGDTKTLISCNIHDIKVLVDIKNGHKTGIYLDQKDNYSVLKYLVKSKSVLDCFCYTGTFGISAAHFGAKHVLGIDASESSIEMSKRNSKLNNVDNTCEWLAGNVFDVINDKSKRKEIYDIVILDPPSFTNAKDSISSALRGYKDINLRALQLLPKGGYLITFCCSHHISRNLFMEVIIDAAKDARKRLRLVEYLTQSKDHPILPAIPETEYLKGFVLQVL